MRKELSDADPRAKVLSDFNFGNASHVYGGVRSRMFRKGDAYDMATEGADCAAL